MGINMTDLTGTPRSDEDLQEAIQVVQRSLANILQPDSPGNELRVMFPTILDLLQELQGFRTLVKKIKAKQAEGQT